MSTAIRIEHLSVRLGSTLALDDISLELPRGKIIGFIGPSGAGKTTLIRTIVGGIAGTAGVVQVFGRPAGTPELRKQVSYMAQELSVYSDLTVEENIAYFMVMAGQSKRGQGRALQELLALVDLTDKRRSLVGDLSGGQKQRVSLAVALIGSPRLIVLDEPTVGLDPVLRASLWNLFGRLAQAGATLIVSSHSMDEAGRCDDLVLVRDGKLLVHATPSALLARTGSTTIEQSFLRLVEGAA